jgi:hypothetical protein
VTAGLVPAGLARLCAGAPEAAYPLMQMDSASQWSAAVAAAVQRLVSAPSAASRVQALDALMDAPLAEAVLRDIGRVRLVGDAALLLDDPARVNQGLKDTCAVATIEAWLAQHDPVEFVRLLAGLASPEGTVLMRGGEPLRRDEHAFPWTPQEGNRSPVSRLMQVAMMEAAAPRLDYRNSRAGHLDDAGGLFSGLDLIEADHLLEGLFGEAWSTVRRIEANMGALFASSTIPRLPADLPALVAHAEARGRPLFAVLHIPPDPALTGHAVLPHKVRLLSINDEWAVYEDPLDPQHPWIPQVRTEVITGYGRCRMATPDFGRILEAVSFPAGFTR